jgi:hypothetical protein
MILCMVYKSTLPYNVWKATKITCTGSVTCERRRRKQENYTFILSIPCIILDYTFQSQELCINICPAEKIKSLLETSKWETVQLGTSAPWCCSYRVFFSVWREPLALGAQNIRPCIHPYVLRSPFVSRKLTLIAKKRKCVSLPFSVSDIGHKMHTRQ